MQNKTACLFAAALIAAASPQTEARESVIGLSPHLPVAEKERLIREVVTYLAATLERGETAYIADAARRTLIGAFTAPDRDGYDGIKARIKANRPAVRGLKAYAAEETGDTAAGIDLAAFLRHVGATYPASEARELIVIGTPLAHDPRTPGFSMLDGAVPNDAHPLASRSLTPYGGAEDAGRLANYRGHFGVAGPDWALSDAHAFAVERFTALSFLLRGARFAGVTVDAASAFRNATVETLPEVEIEPVPGDELLMIRYGTDTAVEAAPDPGPAATIEAAGSIYARALSTRAPARAELVGARDVEIAARWSCDCDFDLAVQPAGGEIISFRKLETAEGQLFKDFTSSEDLDLGWETVSLPAVDLSTTTVAVNLYRGGTGSEVELRIAIGAETWGRRFTVSGAADAGGGFAATMRNGRPASAAWIVVDPMLLMEGS